MRTSRSAITEVKAQLGRLGQSGLRDGVHAVDEGQSEGVQVSLFLIVAVTVMFPLWEQPLLGWDFSRFRQEGEGLRIQICRPGGEAEILWGWNHCTDKSKRTDGAALGAGCGSRCAPGSELARNEGLDCYCLDFFCHFVCFLDSG